MLLLRLLLSSEELWHRYCSIGSTDFARKKMKGMGRRPKLKGAVYDPRYLNREKLVHYRSRVKGFFFRKIYIICFRYIIYGVNPATVTHQFFSIKVTWVVYSPLKHWLSSSHSIFSRAKSLLPMLQYFRQNS